MPSQPPPGYVIKHISVARAKKADNFEEALRLLLNWEVVYVDNFDIVTKLSQVPYIDVGCGERGKIWYTQITEIRH